MARSAIGLAYALIGVLAAACGIGALAASPASTEERSPPLAGLPSVAGEHIGKITALGENEWVNLGPPASDPVCGRARGRTWSAEMPYAPDLRGAFLFGEGVHAFVKPDGHFMDDLWFYDLNAHRWICLYPGWNVRKNLEKIKNGDLAFDEYGFIVDRRGRMQPPVATMIHAYNMVDYDPDRRKFAFMGNQFHYLSKGVLGEAKRLLAQGRPQPPRNPGLAPWFYDTSSGRFERYPAVASPKGKSFSVLEYVSSRRQLFWPTDDSHAWYYDADRHQWVGVPASGPRPSGIDHSSCYDPKRDRVYVGGGGYNAAKIPSDNFFAFDVRTNRWSKPDASGEAPMRFTSKTVFTCDTVHDVVTVILNRAPDGADYAVWQVQSYDPKANTWSEPRPAPKAVGGRGLAIHGFHVPDLNVYVMFFAPDSDDRGTVWAYRYKAASRYGADP